MAFRIGDIVRATLRAPDEDEVDLIVIGQLRAINDDGTYGVERKNGVYVDVDLAAGDKMELLGAAAPSVGRYVRLEFDGDEPDEVGLITHVYDDGDYDVQTADGAIQRQSPDTVVFANDAEIEAFKAREDDFEVDHQFPPEPLLQIKTETFQPPPIAPDALRIVNFDGPPALPPPPVDTAMVRLHHYLSAIPRISARELTTAKDNIQSALHDVLPENFDAAEKLEHDLYRALALREMELFVQAVRNDEVSSSKAPQVVARVGKMGVSQEEIDAFLVKLYDIDAEKDVLVGLPVLSRDVPNAVVPAFVAPIDKAIADAQAGVRPVTKAVENAANAVVGAVTGAAKAVEKAVAGTTSGGKKKYFGNYSYKDERVKAQAKADAYWASHPRSRQADLSRTAKKVVRKAANYNVAKNDFAGVDTRNMGRKLGLVKW